MKFIGLVGQTHLQRGETDSHPSDSEHGVILTPCSAVSVIGLLHKPWSQQDCLCSSPMLSAVSQYLCSFLLPTSLLLLH